ncbi:MAG: hypothetical protein IH851_04345 [Armatimonadetes bacterium]|nr:hypothetical protein [Armatimonadota bacterium]
MNPRVLAACLLVATVTTAHADRVVFLPTGYTLQPGEIRVEFLRETRTPAQTLVYVQAAVMPFLEVQGVWEDLPGSGAAASLNVQYSITQPFPDVLPGVSVGVLDLLGETGAGFSLFTAITWQTGIFSNWATTESANITIGYGTGRFRGAFVALELPMFQGVTFIGEHDSRELIAGLEFEPVNGIALRVLVRERGPLIGVQFRRKF